uniref:AzlC family ABC transporter permease n=1 Tax=uncultured Allobacillus sp. TaxID=1638025 RepID=UPI002599A56B|nr:AzlC family ABC transporter permease [uncultured Allobacillus sp.]
MKEEVVMETEQSIGSAFKQGSLAGMPIFLGYMPIAIAYGVLASQSGLTIFETTMMSVLVFAGAAQFMAANMMAQGALFLQIVVATFVLNFRHFIMSMSFMNQLRHYSLPWKFGLSLGLTDETFAVSALHKKETNKENSMFFYLALILTAYFSWIVGSFAGALLGEIIPSQLSDSMGIALYAMFIGLLTPSVKKEWRIGVVALISMLLNYIFSEYIGLETGWSIVLATVVGSLIAIPMMKEDDVQ